MMLDAAIPTGFDIKLAHVSAQWTTEAPVVCCRFDPLGRYVFAGLESSTLNRFQLKDGKRIAMAGGHESWVFSLAFSKDGAKTFSGGGDGQVTVWETASDTPKPLQKLAAHQGWIRAMGLSVDGKMLVTGGNDKAVRLWDSSTLSPIRELSGHQSHIYSIACHPDGQRVFSGDLMGVVNEWEISTGKLLGKFDAKSLHTYEGGQGVDFGGVRGLCVSADGKFISAGGLYKATNPLGAVHEPIVLLFDTATRKQMKTQIAEGITGGVIWKLAQVADGSMMGACGGSNGGSLIFWKNDAEKPAFKFVLPSLARDMDLHVDGLRVATGHHDRFVRITRLAAKQA
jgi:WD40 repeat protein